MTPKYATFNCNVQRRHRLILTTFVFHFNFFQPNTFEATDHQLCCSASNDAVTIKCDPNPVDVCVTLEIIGKVRCMYLLPVLLFHCIRGGWGDSGKVGVGMWV